MYECETQVRCGILSARSIRMLHLRLHVCKISGLPWEAFAKSDRLKKTPAGCGEI